MDHFSQQEQLYYSLSVLQQLSLEEERVEEGYSGDIKGYDIRELYVQHHPDRFGGILPSYHGFGLKGSLTLFLFEEDLDALESVLQGDQLGKEFIGINSSESKAIGPPFKWLFTD